MNASEAERRTRDLLERDASSVWHPFTQHAVWPDDDPLVIDRAEGMRVFDTQGRSYLDGNSSLWVNVHGHRVPEIDQAIRDQLERLGHTTFLGSTHETGIELAEMLVASTPQRLTRAFFSSDGASSVEAAIKMAFQSAAQRGQHRPLYLHIAEGYHGDTLGAVSVGGIEQFHATYRPLLLATVMADSPGILREGQTRAERAAEVLQQMRELLERDGQRICGIVIEPLVQAAAGMLTHDASFVMGVRQLCDEFDTLMIVDEVATGLGRTGSMWAVDRAGVEPDLLTLGKGITGGYLPLSAVMASESVYESFLGAPTSGRTFFHGHSYTANPLCCAAAIANLHLMDQRNTVAHAAHIGEVIAEELAVLHGDDRVVEVRRIGTMTGIEVAPVDGVDRTGFAVCQHMRTLGVLTRPLSDVVVLMPPLAMSDDDVRTMTAAAIESIRAVVR